MKLDNNKAVKDKRKVISFRRKKVALNAMISMVFCVSGLSELKPLFSIVCFTKYNTIYGIEIY